MFNKTPRIKVTESCCPVVIWEADWSESYSSARGTALRWYQLAMLLLQLLPKLQPIATVLLAPCVGFLYLESQLPHLMKLLLLGPEML